jgi:hypothetical protein
MLRCASYPIIHQNLQKFSLICKTQSQSTKYLRFWIPSDLVRSLVRDVRLIQSWSLLGVVKSCQSSMDIREEYRFLARESLHEDVVFSIPCAVETTIDASAVLCVVST